MNIIKKIKNKFRDIISKQETKSETKLVNYDTSQLFLPKLKDLSKIEQNLVKKYIEEIDLDNFETLINFSKNLNQNANINTNVLIEYLYKLEQEINNLKLIQEEKKLLEKKIELMIQEAKLNLTNQNLLKIKQESLLRTIAVLEIEKKYNSIKYEFLGFFGEANRIKIKNKKNSLNDAVTRMKINLIAMENQHVSIDRTINQLLNLINILEINNIISNVNDDKNAKIKIYRKKIKKLQKIFNVLFEENLIDKERLDEIIDNFKDEFEQELINRLAVIENQLDKYIYENKDKLPSLYEELKNLEISRNNQEENTKKIQKIELIFNLYKKQVSEEYIKILYEKKFYHLILDIDRGFYHSVFKGIKNIREIEVYHKIINQEVKDFFQNKPQLSSSVNKNFIFYIIRNLKQWLTKNKNLDDINYYYCVRLILLVNHADLYKNFFLQELHACRSILTYFFEYDPSIFMNGENNNLITFSDNRTVNEQIQKILKLLENQYKKDIEMILNTDKTPLLFLLLFGKYNIKNPIKVNGKTLTLKDGIKDINFLARNENCVISSFSSINKKIITKIELPSTFENFNLNINLITDLDYLSKTMRRIKTK